jgi:RNA-directed DNA polymerase
MGGNGDMIKAPISLQDLRKRIYVKAKADITWRFWGLYVHVCKMETLREAYNLAKRNKGAPGIDGVTFAAIESIGIEQYLQELHTELVENRYRPMRNRKKEIPKANGKTRELGIPTIRDRIVQGALKLILEPIFEADFQEGSFGYRPKRQASQAVMRVADAVVQGKTRVIDIDLRAYFDTVSHDILLKKIALRVKDDQIMHLIKMVLKASGKKGVSQGGSISPLFSNIYLNEVDKMLEKAKVVTMQKGYTYIEYARWADDLIVLVDGHAKQNWLLTAAHKRLMEEFGKLKLEVNEEKSRIVDISNTAESFTFLGFSLRRMKTKSGKWGVRKTPKIEARTALLRKLKEKFRHHRSQPIDTLIPEVNDIVRGWA